MNLFIIIRAFHSGKQKYWPAKLITNPPKTLGKTPKGCLCVYFFGLEIFTFLDISNVCSYFQNYDEYANTKGIIFEIALERTRDYLEDPKVT